VFFNREKENVMKNHGLKVVTNIPDFDRKGE